MILSVENLRIAFPRGDQELVAVDGVGFAIEEGEVFVVIGESGSGKSLTGMSVVGLTPPNAAASGSIRFKGDEILNIGEARLRKLRGRQIGVVYQDPLSALNPVWPVGEQVAEVLRAHQGLDRRAAARRAVALLERVHIADPARVARAYPHEISGGMRQRAMIAIALAASPSLLIADEPTTALDVTIKAQILELLKELRRELSLTVMLITHDMGVVAELADRILVMYAGKVAEVGPASVVMQRPTHHYTKALMLSAMVSETPHKADLEAIAGTPPMLGEMPPGCRFHPRCPSAGADCRATAPALRRHGDVLAACHHPIGKAGPDGRLEETAG